MKLASYKGGHDGWLMVVANDLSVWAPATDVAPTLQYALDHWADVEEDLRILSDALNSGRVKDVEKFDTANCSAPLPRAYQIADGSAYLNHVELVRKARGAEMPPEFLHDPLMYQAVSDPILAPNDDIVVTSEEYGIDFEGEVAVITGDVPMGATPEEAAAQIRLIMLMNDVSLRNLIPAELAKGFGFFQSKPPSAFSPVAVTPDELGAAWQGGKVHLPLICTLNGRVVGKPNAGVDMQFDFGQLVAHAAKTRRLRAGAIIGSGTISNRDRSAGVACLAETRMIEKIETGVMTTPFMAFGDVIRIEMINDKGASVFGAIEQRVTRQS